VKVPPEATTGPISVTREATSTSSPLEFLKLPLEISSLTPQAGAVGTSVTINGLGFSSSNANNTVKINGLLAEVISSSPTEIKTLVPAGATTGKVSVTVNGETTISINDFNVINLKINETTVPEFYTFGDTNLSATIELNNINELDQLKLKVKSISTNEIIVQPLVFTNTQNVVSVDIPSTLFTDPIGMEVTFILYDNDNQEIESVPKYVYLKYQASTNVHAIPNLVFGSSVKDYQLISIPLNLTDAKVSSVFKNLGRYDNRKYRLYSYISRNNELDKNSLINVGTGYWLIVKKPLEIIPGEGTTVFVTEDTPFSITLYNGWNLIGNPYNFNVLWSDVLAFNNNPADLGNLRHYKNGTFTGTEVLERYRGGFVYLDSDSPITIKIPVIQNTSVNGRLKSNPPLLSSLTASSWTVPITFVDGTIRNELAGIGMHPFATEGKDVWDEVELPFPGVNSLNISIRHLQGTTLIKDVVATQDQYTWTGQISSSKDVTLSWDNDYFGDNEKQLVLEISGEAELIDMRQVTQATIPSGNRTFFIHYGDEQYIKISSKTKETFVGSVFPNPFNRNSESMFIPIALPDGIADVRLSLTDMKGVTAKLSPEAQIEEGRHKLVWKNNFTTLQPGLYILRIAVLHHSETNYYYKKIIIN